MNSSSLGPESQSTNQPAERLSGSGEADRSRQPRKPHDSASVDGRTSDVSRESLPPAHETKPLKGSRIKEILRGATLTKIMRKIGKVINAITLPLARSKAPPHEDAGSIQTVIDKQIRLFEAEAEFESQKLKGHVALAGRNLQKIEQKIHNLELSDPRLLFPKHLDTPDLHGLRAAYEELHEQARKLREPSPSAEVNQEAPIDPNSIDSALVFYGEYFGGNKLAEFTNADDLRQKLEEFKSEHPIIGQLERKVESAASHPGLAYNLKAGIVSLTGPENFIYRVYLDIQKRLKFLEENPPAQENMRQTLQTGPLLTDSQLDQYDLTQSKYNEVMADPQAVDQSFLSDSILDLFEMPLEDIAQSAPVEHETLKFESKFADGNGGVVLNYDPNDDTRSKVTIRFENGKEVTGGVDEVIEAMFDRIVPEKSQEMREGALKVLRSLSEALSQAMWMQEANGVQDEKLQQHAMKVFLAIFSSE